MTDQEIMDGYTKWKNSKPLEKMCTMTKGVAAYTQCRTDNTKAQLRYAEEGKYWEAEMLKVKERLLTEQQKAYTAEVKQQSAATTQAATLTINQGNMKTYVLGTALVGGILLTIYLLTTTTQD